MASKGTKGFIAILVIIAGLLVLNFSVIDIASAIGKVWKTHIQEKLVTLNETILQDTNCGKIIPQGDCVDCQPYQLADLQMYSECLETGKRKKARCSISKKEFYIGCYTDEEKKFWIFQISALILGCLSSMVVWCRSKHLDDRILEKIRKQIVGES